MIAQPARALVSILLAVGLLAAVATQLTPAPRPAAADASDAPLLSVLEGFALELVPQAASGPLGQTLSAELRLRPARDFAALEVSLSASGGLTIEGDAAFTLAAPPIGATVATPLRYRVDGAGASELQVSVTATDRGGARLAVRVGRLFLLANGQEVLQGTSGPLDLQLQRLERDRAAGLLDDAAYAEAREATLGGTASETGTLTGLPASLPAGFAQIQQNSDDLTIAGRMTWTDGAGNLHPVRFAPVEIRDDETFGDDLVATVTTNANGDYLAVVNNDDGFLQDGRDIFVRVLARGQGFFVTNTSGDVYRMQSGIVEDAADGSILNFNLSAGNSADNQTAFSLQSALVTVNQYVVQVRGSSFADVRVNFPVSGETSFFSPSSVTLNILRGDRFDWDVIHHEYGHYVQSRLGIANNPGGPHSIDGNLSEPFDHDNNPSTPNISRGKDAGTRMAWAEGWPTYFGTVAQQQTNAAALGVPNVGDLTYTETDQQCFAYNLEAATYTLCDGTVIQLSGAGEDAELAVQRILWDLYDSADDAGDSGVAFGDATLLSLVDNANALTLSAAYQTIIAGRSVRDTASIGCVLAEHRVAPASSAPGDDTAMARLAPSFSWAAQGGGPTFRNNRFVVELYDAGFNNLLLASPEQAATSFTPSQAQWDAATAAAGASLVWVVRGRQIDNPVTGPYLGCARQLRKADLRLAKSCAPTDTTPLDQPFSCTISVSNVGPVVAASVTVVDTLSSTAPGASYAIGPPSPSSGACSFTVPNQQFSCTLGSLGPGQSATILVAVTPTVAGVFTNQATVDSAAIELNAGDNQASDSVEAIATSDLALAKSVSPSEVAAGGQLRYTLAVSNAGPNAAAQLRLVDTLPAGVIFVGASLPCAEAPAGVVSCDLSNLAIGETREVVLTTVVQGSLPNGSTPTNNAALSYLTGLDPNGANNSAQATAAVFNNRVAAGLVALYTFEEGTGATVHDVGGVGAPLDLSVEPGASVTWTAGGLDVSAPSLIASAGPATKLTAAFSASNELTLEAWVRPNNPSAHGIGRIVTVSGDATTRNLALLQEWREGEEQQPSYTGCLRTSETSPYCQNGLRTPGQQVAPALTHVVYTRDAAGTARLYVDGAMKDNTAVPGLITNWDTAFRLALANELSADRPWLGEFQLVAFYDRALSPAEVGENFAADPAGTTPVVASGVQVRYRFDEGAGTTVRDSAGVGAPLDLTIADPAAASWGPAGLTIRSPTVISSTVAATRLVEAVQATGELTIEAWVTPAGSGAAADRPATIAAIAGDPFHRNVTLDQGLWSSTARERYTARVRTNRSLEGAPMLRTANHSVAAAPTHLVLTRDVRGVTRLYVDGVPQGYHTLRGTPANWDPSYPLVLANDPSGGLPWLGTYRSLSIANRALGPAEVLARYSAGP